MKKASARQNTVKRASVVQGADLESQKIEDYLAHSGEDETTLCKANVHEHGRDTLVDENSSIMVKTQVRTSD